METNNKSNNRKKSLNKRKSSRSRKRAAIIFMLTGVAILCILSITLIAVNRQNAGNSSEGQPVQEESAIQSEDQQTTEELPETLEPSDNEETIQNINLDEGDKMDEIKENSQRNNSNADESNPLAGKKLSIMGDSLSTFEGWIPEGYSVFYPQGELSSVEETWWKGLLSDTDMVLCANASSSGSTCIGDSTSADDPRYGCSDFRIEGLKGVDGVSPDIILVYMGTNDLVEDIPLGRNDGRQSVEEGMITNFSDAYCLILDKLASAYPEAQIFCCGLAQIGNWGTTQPFVTFVNGLNLTSADYNKCIERIAETKGCPYINLYDCGIAPENMAGYVMDGIHFTPDGMKLIKECIEAGLYDYFPAS